MGFVEYHCIQEKSKKHRVQRGVDIVSYEELLYMVAPSLPCLR